MDAKGFLRTLSACIAVAILVSFTPITASAQDATALDPWPKVRKLKDGTVVTVTLTNGEKKKGKVVSSSSRALTIEQPDDLMARGPQTDIQIGQIERVTTRSFRPMVWGALIGAGAAAPFAIYSGALASNEGGDSKAGEALALGIGGGLAAGYALSFQRTHYTRPCCGPSPQVFVTPVILRRGGGFGMAVRF